MKFGEKTCKNILYIKGDKRNIIKFIDGLYGYTSIYNRNNKNEYIRYKAMEEQKPKYPTFNTYAKIPSSVEEHGYKTMGEEYHMKKWGTKLDILPYYEKEIEISRSKICNSNLDIEKMTLKFETYKQPPIQWLKNASLCNPKLVFNLEFKDYLKRSKNIKFKNGEMKYQKQTYKTNILEKIFLKRT